MSVLNQAITITGPRSMDLDRLEAIADMFKSELVREGGVPGIVTAQRSSDERPETLKIDVFIETQFTSPDAGFTFNHFAEFTVYGDNPHVALYRRSAAIGEIQNHVLRGLTSMAARVASNDYVTDNPADYIAKTLEAAIATIPNMSAGR
jgi:hypothetical protein